MSPLQRSSDQSIVTEEIRARHSVSSALPLCRFNGQQTTSSLRRRSTTQRRLTVVDRQYSSTEDCSRSAPAAAEVATGMDRLFRALTSLRDVGWGLVQGQGASGGAVHVDGDDDDWADRLSRRYLSATFAVLSVAVTTKQLVGEPISCWCPAYFTDSHRHYTNSICWISNTFYVPFNVRIPEEIDEEWKSRQVVCYYQWVPVILLTLSAMTLLPTLLWRFLSQRSGIDVASLMASASSGQGAGYAELRDRTMRYCVNQIDRYLLSQRDRRENCCTRSRETVARYCLLIGGKRHGNYLTVCYLIVKVAYIVNAIGQLFLLEYLLGFDYSVYGFRAISSVLGGGKWQFVEMFPRVTLCAFQIRHQARVHDYIVQCALSINLFNEKIFAVIWFCLAAVAIGTTVSLIHWSARVMYWPAQLQFVRRRLRDFDAPGAYSANNRHAKTTLTKFVECYLRRDGLLIVRLLAINVGELAAAETLAGLWENYGPDKRLLGVLSQSTQSGSSDTASRLPEPSVKRRRQAAASTVTMATTSGTVPLVEKSTPTSVRVGFRGANATSRELV